MLQSLPTGTRPRTASRIAFPQLIATERTKRKASQIAPKTRILPSSTSPNERRSQATVMEVSHRAWHEAPPKQHPPTSHTYPPSEQTRPPQTELPSPSPTPPQAPSAKTKNPNQPPQTQLPSSANPLGQPRAVPNKACPLSQNPSSPTARDPTSPPISLCNPLPMSSKPACRSFERPARAG